MPTSPLFFFATASPLPLEWSRGSGLNRENLIDRLNTLIYRVEVRGPDIKPIDQYISWNAMVARPFLCDCIENAVASLSRSRWNVNRERIHRLNQMKPSAALTWQTLNAALWFCRFYCAGSAQTVAFFESEGPVMSSNESGYRVAQKAWAVTGEKWKQAWEGEQQWQTTQLFKYLERNVNV